MRGKRLDQKLDCKACGTIYLDIPEDANEGTPIHCSTCAGYLGTWGELQDDFADQAKAGAYELKRGQIIEK